MADEAVPTAAEVEVPGSTAQTTADEAPEFYPEQGAEGFAEPSDRRAAAAPPVTAPADAGWESIRAVGARLGYTGLKEFENDESALIHLINLAQRSQQADYYSQLGQAIAPHYQGVQQYLAQQQQDQAAAAAAAKSYQPPDWDPNWMSLVERDATSGLHYAKPGVNPAVAEAVNKRLAWQESFSRDPLAMFESFTRDKLGPLVEQQIQQALVKHTQSQQVDGILRANSEWLYQKDQAGNFVRGPGGFHPTAAGSQYIGFVDTLAKAGVTDPLLQDQLARQLTAGALAVGQHPGGAAAQPPRTPAAVTNGRGAPNVNPNQAGGSRGRSTRPGTVEPSPTARSLQDMIRQDLIDSGVTDAELEGIFEQ